MPLSDVIVLVGLLGVSVFGVGTAWYLIKGEIDYRKYIKEQL